jgi:hypothetical protein
MNVLGGFVISNPGLGGSVASEVAFTQCDFLYDYTLPATMYQSCHFDRCRFTMSRDDTMKGGFPGGYFQDCSFGVEPETIMAGRR